MAVMAGNYLTMTIRDYEGEPCVFVSSETGKAIVPLREIQEAATFHSAASMETMTHELSWAPTTKATPDDHPDAEESLPDILADVLRRIRKLESIFDHQGLDNLADEIQRRLVTRLRNSTGR